MDALEGIRGPELGFGTPINFGPSQIEGSHKVWGTMLNDVAQHQPLDLE